MVLTCGRGCKSLWSQSPKRDSYASQR